MVLGRLYAEKNQQIRQTSIVCVFLLLLLALYCIIMSLMYFVGVSVFYTSDCSPPPKLMIGSCPTDESERSISQVRRYR